MDCLLLDQGVFGVPLTMLCQREQQKKEAPIKPPKIFCEVSNVRSCKLLGFAKTVCARLPLLNAKWMDTLLRFCFV